MALLPKIDPNADWRTVGSTVPNPVPGQEDDSSVWSVLLKDIAVVSAVYAAWTLYDLWALSTEIILLVWLSVPLGIMAGMTVGLKLHEWGHFTGARAFGGHAPITNQFGLLMFQFNMVENTRIQFLMMGIFGQLFTLVAVVLMFILSPVATPGAVALKTAVIVAFLVGLSTDSPVIWRSLKGADNAEAWRPHFENLQYNRNRAYVIGLLGGVFYLAIKINTVLSAGGAPLA